MEWFKMFTEARTDVKLRKLTDEQFRVWFNLLCFAAEQPERGNIAYEDFYLLSLEVADENEELLAETLARLVKLRVVSHEGQTILFLNFNARQSVKPSDSAEATRERKQRQRERQQFTLSHAPVTPRHAPVTPQEKNRVDKIREEEKEESRAPAHEVSLQTAPPPTTPEEEAEPDTQFMPKEAYRASQRQKADTPYPPPQTVMDTPLWFSNLAGRGYRPTEITEANRVATQQRNKNPADFTNDAWANYLAKVIDSTRQSGGSAMPMTQPPPRAKREPTPEEIAQREQEKREHEELLRKSDEHLAKLRAEGKIQSHVPITT